MVLSYIYELLFGHGKHFGANATAAAERIIGGWQVGGITTLSTGSWFTVTGATSIGAQSDGQQRPDQISRPNGKPCLPGTFFKPALSRIRPTAHSETQDETHFAVQAFRSGIFRSSR